jgi:hypothetical protein
MQWILKCDFSRILLQQLLLDMVREGTVILSECPPQRWEGGTVHQWRERSRKLDDLCSLAALCSLKEMSLSGSGDRVPSLDGPTKAVVDHCSQRAAELELEDEEDVDEYILHDIGRLQMSQMGLNNYRRLFTFKHLTPNSPVCSPSQVCGFGERRKRKTSY